MLCSTRKYRMFRCQAKHLAGRERPLPWAQARRAQGEAALALVRVLEAEAQEQVRVLGPLEQVLGVEGGLVRRRRERS